MASFITAKEIIFIAIKSNKIKVIFILYYFFFFSLIFLKHIIIINNLIYNFIKIIKFIKT